LQPSNHLVDLIYEAIIHEGNNKEWNSLLFMLY
jgi:hypothetical protein